MEFETLNITTFEEITMSNCNGLFHCDKYNNRVDQKGLLRDS